MMVHRHDKHFRPIWIHRKLPRLDQSSKTTMENGGTEYHSIHVWGTFKAWPWDTLRYLQRSFWKHCKVKVRLYIFCFYLNGRNGKKSGSPVSSQRCLSGLCLRETERVAHPNPVIIKHRLPSNTCTIEKHKFSNFRDRSTVQL